ncbi:5'-3' exoribonuclease 3-like [Senna tora]|uniref:5'-3' exoribonuclease 3-like n=1 Tax=Senna tora TaxID=362788 RepID=A0A834WIW9_9FABA|nr:5'-3' exoribonuclease 3-like [Senna tora]
MDSTIARRLSLVDLESTVTHWFVLHCCSSAWIPSSPIAFRRKANSRHIIPFCHRISPQRHFMVDFDPVNAKIKLRTRGWKERYYKVNFSVDNMADIESKRKEVVQKYTEGLVWVLKYYYSGVPSWTWFYPYNYAPFASYLKGMSQLGVYGYGSLALGLSGGHLAAVVVPNSGP